VGLTVTDVEVSRQWYQRLLNAAPVLDEDLPPVPEHHQGFHKVVFVLPGGFVLALVAHPATDRNRRFDEFGPGLDHTGFGCADRSELEKWQNRLDELGIEHGVIAEDAAGFALPFVIQIPSPWSSGPPRS
jgi:glyoxylase I family protein